MPLPEHIYKPSKTINEKFFKGEGSYILVYRRPPASARFVARKNSFIMIEFHYFIPDRSTNNGIHFENHDPVVNKHFETHRSRVQLAKLSKKGTDPAYKAEWNHGTHELNHYKCQWRRAKILLQRINFYIFKLLLSMLNLYFENVIFHLKD